MSVGPHQDGDVSRPDGLAPGGRTVGAADLDVGSRGQQPDEISGQIVGDVLPGGGGDGEAVFGQLDQAVGPLHHAQA